MPANDHTTESNHKAIQWEVTVARLVEVYHKTEVRWNSATITANNVEAREKLQMELVKTIAHLDAECTADNAGKSHFATCNLP
jgi:hypothetical protein